MIPVDADVGIGNRKGNLCCQTLISQQSDTAIAICKTHEGRTYRSVEKATEKECLSLHVFIVHEQQHANQSTRHQGGGKESRHSWSAVYLNRTVERRRARSPSHGIFSESGWAASTATDSCATNATGEELCRGA